VPGGRVYVPVLCGVRVLIAAITHVRVSEQEE
jgi:hypothetical protein